MVEDNGVEAPAEKKMRIVDDSDITGKGKTSGSLSELKTLESFCFKEVLGSLPEEKAIFILCHDTVEDKPAILILNKNAFPENGDELSECIKKLELVHLSDNDIYLNAEAHLPLKFNVTKSTFIYPCTEKHIVKYRMKPLHSIFETPEDYDKLTLPYIKEGQFSINWVYNILDGKKEQELVLIKDENPETGFFLMKDLKWDGKTLESLYYQAIVVRRDLKSVRDLNKTHLPMLENILDKSLKAIEEKHGLPASRVKVHFHYQPTYYHLHVHFRHIGSRNDAPYIFLQSAISNIKLASDFYQRATLQFAVRENHPLYEKYLAAGRV